MISPHSITLSIDEAKALITAIDVLGNNSAKTNTLFYEKLLRLGVFRIYTKIEDAVKGGRSMSER